MLPAGALGQDVDPSEDRYLGPERDVTLLAFPLEAALNATSGSPQLALEVRKDLGHGLAIAVRPIGVWYLPNDNHAEHGGGIGVALGIQWYTRRALSGPFVAIQGGDIEAFIAGERGRMFGASAIFGWSINWEGGAVMSVGVGLGYWHREGVLDSGVQWPEILSIRLGTGWGWSAGPNVN